MSRISRSRILLLLISISLLSLSGCNEDSANNESSMAEIPADQIAAKVNDTIISKDDLKFFKEMKGNPQIDDSQLLDEIIVTELLREEANKLGISNRDNVKYQINFQEGELLARLVMREKFSNLNHSEEELKAAYDSQMSNAANREFKARHILLKTEDEASAVIEALRNGADFIELAKERSTGPSGPNGGDLGWFQASRMVPPFAEAVKQMNKGDISVAPVQTNFGFHVIKLDDVRELEMPSFESKREELRQTLIREAINQYIADLQANATISKN